jgi:diaminohydroxyphosphoribosylaminopyrimidine deaminase/5-amino-6-(5-phosphoribosylamino)uracil reductase
MVDIRFMRLALRLAERGYGTTSPNPTVGALLVKNRKIIGRGYTAPAGGPHGEIAAIRDAQKRGEKIKGATLYVTLEPCCTHGRTPPCTDAIIAEGIKRVVVGTPDPNPKHSGHGFDVLKRAGIEVSVFDQGRARPSWARRPERKERPALKEDIVPSGNKPRRARSDAPYQKLADECANLNKAFNHWIIHRTPLVTVKAAMTLDGKIATTSGESKWITGEKAREYGMKLRQGSDAILVGINTVLADNPQLTIRSSSRLKTKSAKVLRRIILDPQAKTPLDAKVIADEFAKLTTVVVTKAAAKNKIAALTKNVSVIVAPLRKNKIDLPWLMKTLGAENVTSLLVEGGGETNALFFEQQAAREVAFFYAPKIIGGREARKAVGGTGIGQIKEAPRLRDVQWKTLGEDLLLRAQIAF